MMIYNNQENYGDGGPFRAESFEALADDMQPNFEEWADEWESDLICETDPYATRDDYLAACRRDFIAGLCVVCEDCGTHGEVGDAEWSHTAHECEIIRQERLE